MVEQEKDRRKHRLKQVKYHDLQKQGLPPVTTKRAGFLLKIAGRKVCGEIWKCELNKNTADGWQRQNDWNKTLKTKGTTGCRDEIILLTYVLKKIPKIYKREIWLLWNKYVSLSRSDKLSFTSCYWSATQVGNQLDHWAQNTSATPSPTSGWLLGTSTVEQLH